MDGFRPTLGERVYVDVMKGEHVYRTPAKVVWIGDHYSVQLLTSACKGWEAGDTYRATLKQLHPLV